MRTPPAGPAVFNPRLLLWLGLDLFGMLLFGLGAVYLANGQSLLKDLPGSLVEAAILLVAGGVLMLIAAANCLRIFRPAADKAEDRVLGDPK